MRQRILVVEDEPSVRDVVRGYLQREGYEVLSATDGLEGLAMARARHPSAAVLDLMLPRLGGDELCALLRRESSLGILMLTGCASEAERVRGFQLGADDYLTKPFSPRELVARVRALLRRVSPATDEPVDTVLDGGRLRIDGASHQAIAGDVTVDLTPCEYRLLVTLAGAPGRVFSRSALVNAVQRHGHDGCERTIDVHVKNLRRKVEPDPAHPCLIETVHGVGYRFAREAA